MFSEEGHDYERFNKRKNRSERSEHEPKRGKGTSLNRKRLSTERRRP